MRPPVVRFLRRVHLLLGVFFAPLLLFFILTGWYQTVTPDRRKGVGDSDDILSRLNRVHSEQYFPSKTAEGYSTRLFTRLVVAMAVALTLTIILGVLLAFHALTSRWTVWAALILGLVVPVVLLYLGQQPAGP